MVKMYSSIHQKVPYANSTTLIWLGRCLNLIQTHVQITWPIVPRHEPHVISLKEMDGSVMKLRIVSAGERSVTQDTLLIEPYWPK